MKASKRAAQRELMSELDKALALDDERDERDERKGIPSGEAMKQAVRAQEQRRANANAAKNRDMLRAFCGDTELTADELKAEQVRLKQRFYARNPHFLGTT